ncbi:hypothetical protein Mmc1_3450 [Magnetococcus marinus MC-1]|uniref:Uncharacterized protein n=1 Tax=Magnetococcus marinus (strain ATCC BAA-1437 / JCM 17883 / MC-1) TaxID=156889 RepID=A0LD92_MAGMM|nr:hypothetical protein [Magnetococcus marinus]ABK45935.1 hypothetical protein Mmc1_3450 [Magnetococcus marinus MC-1]
MLKHLFKSMGSSPPAEAPYFPHLQENMEQRRYRLRRTAGLLLALLVLLLGFALTLWTLVAHLGRNPQLALVGALMIVTLSLLNAWLVYRLVRGTPPSGIERGKFTFIRMGWNWAWNYLVLSLRGESAFVEPTRNQVEGNRQAGFAGILTGEMLANNQDERIEGDHWQAYMEELEQADEAYHQQLQALDEAFERYWDDTLPDTPLPAAAPPAGQQEAPETAAHSPIPSIENEAKPTWVNQRVADLESQLESRQTAYDAELEAVYAPHKSPRPTPTTKASEERIPSPAERLQEFFPHPWCDDATGQDPWQQPSPPPPPPRRTSDADDT